MNDLVIEIGVELLAGLGALLFTGAGLVIDRAAFENIFMGQLAMGAWELLMGSLLIFVGVYLFGYQEFWTRLQQRRLL